MNLYIADLHTHSCFSRATSRDMTIPNMAFWARKKGISLLSSADFTHPQWLEHLRQHLKPTNKRGIFSYDGVEFVLGCEVSNIFSRKDVSKRTYRVHSLIYCPCFEDVEAVNRYLSSFGSLNSDGRPMLGLDVADMCAAIKRISPDSFVCFAHIWTPWYSLFGSRSGFDSMQEAFPDGVPDNVIALETGLSSDPRMNRMCSFLDEFRLFSNSDAHSPMNLGREANVFEIEPDFYELKAILRDKKGQRFKETIEFFPEEGKYHYDGHRECGVCLHPKETLADRGLCPVCGRPLTIGVLNRVWTLKDKEENRISDKARYIVPLVELISFVKAKGKAAKTVLAEYEKIVGLVPELKLLLYEDLENYIGRINNDVLSLIKNMREGRVEIKPGCDGVYGKVEIERPLQGLFA